MRHLGAYSSTAPYNCEKSARILSMGLPRVYDEHIAGITFGASWRVKFNAITMLLSDNPAHLDKLREIVRGLVPDAKTRRLMMADERDATRMVTWERGYMLVLMAEYYLATGEETGKNTGWRMIENGDESGLREKAPARHHSYNHPPAAQERWKLPATLLI